MLWYNAARSGEAIDLGYSPANYLPVLTLGHVGIALYGNLFSSGRGLLFFAPVLILGLFGIKVFWRRWRAEALLVYIVVIASYLLFATRPNWATIWPWGPRYIEPLVPLLMIPVAFALPRLWPQRTSRSAVSALVAVSVALQVLAVLVPYGTWLHKVRPVYGEEGCVFDWRCNPYWGQIDTLRRARLDPIPLASVTGAAGPMSAEVKRYFRESLDFWFVYAYRLGVPAALWGTGCVALIVLTAGASWRLCAALADATSARVAASSSGRPEEGDTG
jgi:hypothetical protein